MTDPALWAAVYAHRDRLFRIARRRTDCDAAAEDVVSEAMLRVATFPALDPDRVGSMLTSVTLRLCVDAARHRYVERSVLPRLQDVAPDPVADLLDDAEARWLATVPLTAMERTLLLARVHGLYPSEVAEGLGLSVPAAKDALRRARKKVLAAWKTTLGLVGLSRLRRLLPASGVVAVAAAAYVLAPLLSPAPSVVVVPAAVAMPPDLPERRAVWRAIAAPPPPALWSGARREPRPATAAAPRVARPAPAPVRLPVPGVEGKKFRVAGGAVVLDLEESPEERLRRCAASGLDLDPRNLSLTCR